MKCVPIGGATIDIIVQVAAQDADRLTMHNTQMSFMMVELGRKIETDSIQISVGGGAINASVAMSRLGHNVSPIVKIKQDMNGEKIAQLLAKKHIDKKNICTNATAATATSILLSSIERDPTVFTYRGANTQLSANDVTFDALQGADLVYITALSGDSANAFSHIVQIAKQANAFVATNPGILQIQRYGSDIVKNFPHINCLTLNMREASYLIPAVIENLYQHVKVSVPEQYRYLNNMRRLKSGLSNGEFHMSIPSFMKSVTMLGVQYMVITDGHQGVYMGTKDGIYFAPAMQTKVAGTIGAGDAFASTLTTYLANDPNCPQTALIAATINSASVVSYTDTQTGLLNMEHIQNHITPDMFGNVLFMPYI